MRLLADVNVSRHVVNRLKALGYDVTRVSEIMDARSSDHEIISEARRRGAVLVSHDQDFGAVLRLTTFCTCPHDNSTYWKSLHKPATHQGFALARCGP